MTMDFCRYLFAGLVSIKAWLKFWNPAESYDNLLKSPLMTYTGSLHCCAKG